MIIPRHLKKKVNDDYRLIVISDIHGHLDRFRLLLENVNYTTDDYLVILGDFVEKGDQVIETIHFIKELSQNERVFVLAGNCEWALDALLTIPELALQIPKYFQRVSANGCIRQIYHQLHLDDGRETILGVQKQIANYLKDELSFISHLPVTLKFNQFLFVHAGVEKRKDYKKSSLSSLLEMQSFYTKGHILEEIVVVGHLPVSNYYQKSIDNNVLIDLDKKIICIDGGTGVKAISQLNALIIESRQGHISYQKEFVQPLPQYTVHTSVLNDQKEPHKISYPYFQVELIEKGEQFSLCYQKETDQKLYIKNEFLYEKDYQLYCLDDYIDTMLSIQKNEKVYLLGIYDEYAYVIYQGNVGWIKSSYISMTSSK